LPTYQGISGPDQLTDNQLTDNQKIVITTITITLAEEALAEEVVSKALPKHLDSPQQFKKNKYKRDFIIIKI